MNKRIKTSSGSVTTFWGGGSVEGVLTLALEHIGMNAVSPPDSDHPERIDHILVEYTNYEGWSIHIYSSSGLGDKWNTNPR